MSQSDFVTRGQALVSAGQYQEAVKVCRLGLLGRPTTVDGRVVLGTALLALKRFDEVLVEMRVALELDGTSIDAQVLKGEALLRKREAAQAIDVLKKVRSQAPTDPRIAALLAEAERGAGKPRVTASHPSVGFVSPSAANEQPTRAAPPRPGALPSVLPARAPAGAVAQGRGKPRQDFPADEQSGGSYTRPTSLAAPSAKKRSTPRPQLNGDHLAVGDKSGTHDIDPSLEGIEIEDDDDDDIAPPPPSQQMRAQPQGGERGRVMPSSLPAGRKPLPPPNGGAAPRPGRKEDSNAMELDDEDVEDFSETNGGPPSNSRRSRSEVRNAVRIPSGPLDAYVPAANARGPQSGQYEARTAHHAGGAPPPMPLPAPPSPYQATSGLASPTASPFAATVSPFGAQPAPSPPLAHLLANQAHAVQMGAPMPPALAPGASLPLGGPRFTERGVPGMQGFDPNPPQSAQMIKAALPTAMAMPMPQQPLSMAQQQSANVVDSLFGAPVATQGNGYAGQPATPFQQQPQPQYMPGIPDAAPPAWAQSTLVAGSAPHAAAMAQTHMAYEALPQQQYEQQPAYGDMQPQYEMPAPMHVVSLPDNSASMSSMASGASGARAMKTGMRRTRSKLAVVVWIFLGAAMIGGGVFAGFKIRAIRLNKQIMAARGQAVSLAKEDAWRGWVGARDRLAGIAHASATIDNRAALARVRALVAYEFGDGYPQAKAAVDALGSGGGLDGAIAAAYIALADSDAKAAKTASDKATELAPNDAAVLYVSGRSALLNGDSKTALVKLAAAFKAEPRPLYAVGLAAAQGQTWAWDDGLDTLQPLLTNAPDLAAAVIERARLMTRSGRVAAQSPATSDIRQRLLKAVGEGSKDVSLQSTRGVSPSQVAYAYVMLARIDAARMESPQGHIGNALVVTSDFGVDDQRFAEEVIEALYAVGMVKQAKQAAVTSLERWPQSRKAITALAEVALTEGDAKTALDQFAKLDLANWPDSLVVRARAKLGTGDRDGAREDYETALKKLPGFEPASIGLAELELEAGDVAEARSSIEPRYDPKTATPALTTMYAAILRATGDTQEREKARDLLLAVTAGPPTMDIPRAQLELARVQRDLGDLKAARFAYAESSKGGNLDAKLESALLLLDDRDAAGAATALDQLVKATGDAASAQLLIEDARASMLVGNHIGAEANLERAAKLPDAQAWQLDRERGRLLLRRGDYAGAAEALTRALDNCGPDAETFLLAAEVATSDDPPQTALAEKVRGLATTRLANQPEAFIIAGKLAIAGGKLDEAATAFDQAAAALDAAKAPNRRRAQATYGSAYVFYTKQDDARAATAFDLAIKQDPSLYAAYLYQADLLKATNPKAALDLAQMAVKLDPDTVQGWYLLGVVAATAPNKKLMDEAIVQVNELAPNSEALVDLQQRARAMR